MSDPAKHHEPFAAPATQGSATHGRASSNYEVGYAKPPEATRFQKGKSGNPAGRPKGSRGVHGLVNSALDETIRVAENGRPRSMKKRQAILLSMIAKAIKGDVRAATLVLKLMESHDPTQTLTEGQLSHEDWLELLERENNKAGT